jgi:hypothetical protein
VSDRALSGRVELGASFVQPDQYKEPDQYKDRKQAEAAARRLAALSKLPKEIVEQLSMFGLIEARNGLYGLRDLAAARQVAGLLAAGTVLSVITKSLHEIRNWLPDAGLSKLKLFPESSDRILVEQIGRPQPGALPTAAREPCRSGDVVDAVS